MNNLLPLYLALIALFERTESAGIVQSADFFSQAHDAADALDGNHQRRVRQRDATGVPVEQGEEHLLLADVPTTIAWRKAVGMVPA